MNFCHKNLMKRNRSNYFVKSVWTNPIAAQKYQELKILREKNPMSLGSVIKNPKILC